MEPREIVVELRSQVGTGHVNRLRRAGQLPAVVYSEGKSALSLVVNHHGFQRATAGAGGTQLYRFKSTEKNLDGLLTLIKDMQIEPLKQKVLHVDFLSLTQGHRIVLTVPVQLTGVCVPVKLGEAILNHTVYEIEVECLPSNIPNVLTVDISSLIEGHSLHVGDIVLPEGVELVTDPEISVVSVLAKREEEPTTTAAPEAAAAVATPAGEEKEKK